jgi:hypothetical protein
LLGWDVLQVEVAGLNCRAGTQRVHTSGSRDLVQPVGYRVQVIVKQIGVQVQSHGCARVPEHPLNGLDVRAGADSEARRCVPELMRGETRLANGLGSTVEPSSASVPVPHDGARDRREHQLVLRLRSDVWCKRVS